MAPEGRWDELADAPRPLRAVPTSDEREAALQAVFDREWAPMVRLASLLLDGDSRRAEEVVQDSLLGLYRAWGRLADPERGAGYLRRSVVNRCRSVHRRRNVERRHLHSVLMPERDPHVDSDDVAEHDRVIRALRGLPTRQREVLVLRYFADASEEQIAETLGISRGAVKTHAHRGVAAVRTALLETDDA